MIEIARFADVYEAEIVASRLRAEGYDAVLGGAEHAKVNFLVLQALIGLAVLVQFNGFAIVLGICSLVIVAAYPFMKRITNWPQFVLGLAFSWGALMGWAAAFADLDPPAILLYLGSILWVIGYDTIYAHQDKEDDALVGVRSTALLFGENTKYWLSGLYAGALMLFAAAFAAAPSRPSSTNACANGSSACSTA